MIQFDQVTIRFGYKQILDRVSLHIQAGEKAVIDGESGSGKSTLLRAVVGACIPEAGEIRFDGTPIGPGTIAAVREAVAFIGQEPVLGAETVREALLLPFSFKSHRNRVPGEDRIRNEMIRFRLDVGLLDQSCGSLSGGEKQRVAVIRAALLGKRVFLADEITSALDAANSTLVMDRMFAPEHTVVSVSHDPNWIERCDRRFILAAGRLAEDKRHANR